MEHPRLHGSIDYICISYSIARRLAWLVFTPIKFPKSNLTLIKPPIPDTSLSGLYDLRHENQVTKWLTTIVWF